MFHLLRLRDVIELESAYLPRPDALKGTAANDNKYRATAKDLLWHRATEKYVNKIVANQGLCVAIDEIEECSSGCLRGNEGSAWSTIEFTAVIFRPTAGQRVAATIAGQDEAGITLSISFFAVFVPAHQLLPKSFFDKTKRSWFVLVEDDEDDEAAASAAVPPPAAPSSAAAAAAAANAKANAAPEAARNYYTNGDEALVAIDNVFVRTLSDTGATERLAPMEVVGSFSAADGLGPRSWYE